MNVTNDTDGKQYNTFYVQLVLCNANAFKYYNSKSPVYLQSNT